MTVRGKKPTEAGDYALAAAEVMAAIGELHARDGVDDVFGRLPAEAVSVPRTSGPDAPPAAKGPRQRRAAGPA